MLEISKITLVNVIHTPVHSMWLTSPPERLVYKRVNCRGGGDGRRHDSRETKSGSLGGRGPARGGVETILVCTCIALPVHPYIIMKMYNHVGGEISILFWSIFAGSLQSQLQNSCFPR